MHVLELREIGISESSTIPEPPAIDGDVIGAKSESGARKIFWALWISMISIFFLMLMWSIPLISCFGSLIGLFALILGAAGFFQMHNDREAFHDAHRASVERSFKLFLLSIVGILVVTTFNIFLSFSMFIYYPGLLYRQMILIGIIIYLVNLVFNVLFTFGIYYLFIELEDMRGRYVLFIWTMASVVLLMVDNGVQALGYSFIDSIPKYMEVSISLDIANMILTLILLYAVHLCIKNIPVLRKEKAEEMEKRRAILQDSTIMAGSSPDHRQEIDHPRAV